MSDFQIYWYVINFEACVSPRARVFRIVLMLLAHSPEALEATD
jgi:hypothetical protein